MKRKSATGGIRTAAFIAAGAVVLASLPTAGFALGALGGDARLPGASLAALTPASADPRLAEFVSQRTGGDARLLRFTPAGAKASANRSVTVAVRVGEDAARAISVRSAIEAAKDQVAGEARLRIAPTRYSLGIARDYQNFAKPAPALSRSLSDAAIPDLAEFRPATTERQSKSRFAARISPAEEGKPEASIAGEQAVDLTGSYRLTRNLDVTAGVRYTQERDRLAPLPDAAKQDSQAVYVGTQFRF